MQDGSRKCSATISADMGRSQAGAGYPLRRRRRPFAFLVKISCWEGADHCRGTQKENENLVEANKGKTG